MDKLELIVFNIGHGLSVVLIERLSNYVTLIDLGSNNNFSPYEYLQSTMHLFPDILFITHPHGDHIRDIYTVVNSNQQPSYIDVQIYDWRDVEQRERIELRNTLKTYVNYINYAQRGNYAGEASLKYWRYTPEDARRIHGETTYINNSSLFFIYTWRSFKIAIPGDLHSDAMEAFIKCDEFKSAADNTDLLISPHHGHKEGFTSLWADKIGKPYLTLVSVQENDPHIASGYSKPEFAKGVNIDGKTRSILTTRQDGNIKVEMYYDRQNQPTWNFSFF